MNLRRVPITLDSKVCCQFQVIVFGCLGKRRSPLVVSILPGLEGWKKNACRLSASQFSFHQLLKMLALGSAKGEGVIETVVRQVQNFKSFLRASPHCCPFRPFPPFSRLQFTLYSCYSPWSCSWYVCGCVCESLNSCFLVGSEISRVEFFLFFWDTVWGWAAPHAISSPWQNIKLFTFNCEK